MPSTAVTWEELRDRLDVLEVIGNYVRLQRRGAEYLGLCPFHDDKSPSLSVNAEKGVFLCRACQAKGTTVDFVMRMERLEFREAIELLAGRMGLTLAVSPEQRHRADDRERLQKVCGFAAEAYERALWNPAGQAAREYLARRGVSDEVARQFRLGYAPGGWDKLVGHLEEKGHRLPDAEAAGLIMARKQGDGYYDRFRHRLIFPIVDQAGRVVAFGGRVLNPEDEPKYLNSSESAIFSKRRLLYGLPYAVGHLETGAVVVEGYMDVIALHQHGVVSALATMGTALTPEHLRLLRRHTGRVILCYDADVAGNRATDRAATAFIEEGVDGRVLSLPAGQDPDDYVRSHGREAFEALVAAAPDLLEHRLQAALAAAGADPASRAAAVRETVVAVLGDIQDEVRQSEYARRVAAWWAGSAVGMQEDFERTVLRALRRRRGGGRRRAADREPPRERRAREEQVERDLLRVYLERPHLLTAEALAMLRTPGCRDAAAALAAAAPESGGEALLDSLPEATRGLAAELLCTEAETGATLERLLAELKCNDLEAQAAELRSRVETLPTGDAEAEAELWQQVLALEAELDAARRALLEH